MPFFSHQADFTWSSNDGGLAVRFSTQKQWRQAQLLKASPSIQRGYRRMLTLAECGEAEVREVDEGIFISTLDAVRIDEATRELLQLPGYWPGGMRLKTESVPQLSGFTARLGLVDAMAGVVWNWRLRGPILEIGESYYLPTAAQFAALFAFHAWKDCPIMSAVTQSAPPDGHLLGFKVHHFRM
jgi:hypothetical protein